MPNRNRIDPRTLPGLFAWYDANYPLGFDAALPADATALSAWNDLSGNGRHLAQGTGANQPTLRRAVQNGLAVVRSADATDTMQAAVAGTNPRPVTVIAVFKNSEADDAALNRAATFNAQRIGLGVDWATANAFTAVDDNVASATSGVAGDITTFHVASFVARPLGTRSTLAVDGVRTYPAGAAGTNTNRNVDAPVTGFIGDLCEIMVFTDEFPVAMITNIEEMLAQKWGVIGGYNRMR